MKRPSIVTGIACLNLLDAVSALEEFGRRTHMRAGVDPILPGSVFPVQWQWDWWIAAICLTFLTTLGLFRGWNWARWLALVLCILGYIVAMPVGDVRILPHFFFTLAGSVLVYWLVFFSPTVNLYFTRAADSRPGFAIHGAVSTILIVFAVLNAYRIVMGVFWKALSVETAWIDMGLFILPALLLTLVIRWHLEISLREISAFLLSAALFFTYLLLSDFLALHFAYRDAAMLMRHFDWLHSALLTLAFGAGGSLLAVYIMRRYRVASMCQP